MHGNLIGEKLAKIEPETVIVFTCSVCDTRQGKSMSKKAYTEGVVLITCDGCKKKHLIADNLGWFGDSKTTVETLLNEKGLGEHIRRLQASGDDIQFTKDDLADMQLAFDHSERRQADKEKRRSILHTEESRGASDKEPL